MLCLLTRAWVFVGVEWLAFKIGLLGCSLFLYFVTTALVAVLLRETQARVHQWSRTFSAGLVANPTTIALSLTCRVRNTVRMNQQLRRRMPPARRMVNHAARAVLYVLVLVGVVLLISEILDDRTTALLLLALIWLCEFFIFVSYGSTSLMDSLHSFTD